MLQLSVIIPAYNVSEYIEACLYSVIQQTYQALEIIVINDGSTDDTLEKITQVAAEHPQIQVYSHENIGLSATRNKGVALATGEYITFVDSDDVLDARMYEKMVGSLYEAPADIVTIGVDRLAEDQTYTSVLHKRFMKETIYNTSIFESTRLLYDTTSWNKIYRKAFWEREQLEFPEGYLFEDIPVVMKAYLATEQVNLIAEVGYLWRSRTSGNKSITQQKNSLKMTKDRLHALHLVDSYFAEKNVGETLQYKKELKFLKIDLFSMMEWAFLSKAYYKEIQPLIKAYVEAHIHTDAMQGLSKIKQQFYRYLLADNYPLFVWTSWRYAAKKIFKKIKN